MGRIIAMLGSRGKSEFGICTDGQTGRFLCESNANALGIAFWSRIINENCVFQW